MGAVQIHDEYGKRVMREAFGVQYDSMPEFRYYGGDKKAGKFRVDGEIKKNKENEDIDNDIVVEIESRASKQVEHVINFV